MTRVSRSTLWRDIRTMPGGRISEVAKDRQGKWQPQSKRLSPVTVYRLSIGSVAMVLLTLGIAFGPGLLRGS